MSNKKGIQAQAKVLMEDGTLKPLYQVEVGDRVVGKDKINTVIEVAKYNAKPYKIYGINDTQPFLFEGQPVYTEKGWSVVNFDFLAEYDPLTIDDITKNKNETLDILDNDAITSVVDENEIYQLALDGDHTYYLEGHLVHNHYGSYWHWVHKHHKWWKYGPYPFWRPLTQPVITAGNLGTAPTVFEIGSTKVSSGAPEFNLGSTNTVTISSTVPAVTISPPVTPPAAVSSISLNIPFVSVPQPQPLSIAPPVVATQDAKAALDRADSSRDILCADLLDNPSSLFRKFEIQGNGAATRFQFDQRGAPTNVKVTREDTGANITAYTIAPRPSSFSFITFDEAVPENVIYVIEYEISGNTPKCSPNQFEWSRYVAQLKILESSLNTVKLNVFDRSRNLTGVKGWSLSDPSLVENAIDAVRILRSLVGNKYRPNIDANSVAQQCAYLESQINRINDDLVNINIPGVVIAPIPQPPVVNPPVNCPAIYPPLPGCGATVVYPTVTVVTPVVNLDVRINVIYDNDRRYSYYFRGPDGYWYYRPLPHYGRFTYHPTKRWRRKYDNRTRRYYYEPCGAFPF